MKNSPLALALLAILTIMTTANVYKAHGIEVTLTHFIEEEPMSTSWQSARGTETVTTVQREGEGDDDFLDRHDAMVAKAQARHPKVGGGVPPVGQ